MRRGGKGRDYSLSLASFGWRNVAWRLKHWEFAIWNTPNFKFSNCEERAKEIMVLSGVVEVGPCIVIFAPSMVGKMALNSNIAYMKADFWLCAFFCKSLLITRVKSEVFIRYFDPPSHPPHLKTRETWIASSSEFRALEWIFLVISMALTRSLLTNGCTGPFGHRRLREKFGCLIAY